MRLGVDRHRAARLGEQLAAIASFDVRCVAKFLTVGVGGKCADPDELGTTGSFWERSPFGRVHGTVVCRTDECPMSHPSAGLSWEHPDVRAGRMRILIAVALVSAAWMTGFFSGRVSAWIVPVASINMAEKIPARDYASMQAAAATAVSRKDEAKFRIPAAPALPTAALPMNSETGAAAPQAGTALNSNDIFEGLPSVAGKTPGVARKSVSDKHASEPEPRDKARGRETNPPNAHWTVLAPQPRHRDIDDEVYGTRISEREQFAVIECERRYASFRRSDGTYQPFSSTLRERCPLLR